MFKQLVPLAIGNALLDSLYNEINWTNPGMPRFTYFMANCLCPYKYSKHSIKSAPWHNELYQLVVHLCQILKLNVTFDCANLNLYEGTNQSVGWHADDEDKFGSMPTILSISLGSSRLFQLRTLQTPHEYDSFVLDHLDVCLMQGNLQSTHEHQVPKQFPNDPTSIRINITARVSTICTCGPTYHVSKVNTPFIYHDLSS